MLPAQFDAKTRYHVFSRQPPQSVVTGVEFVDERLARVKASRFHLRNDLRAQAVEFRAGVRFKLTPEFLLEEAQFEAPLFERGPAGAIEGSGFAAGVISLSGTVQ